MAEAGATPEKGKPGKDPFGPPLDATQVRELFRRLERRPQAEQEAFIKRLNWNLVDPLAEMRVFEWLIANLESPEPVRQVFALQTLEKIPHPKRARHLARMRQVLAGLDADLAARVAAAFGPVLGGPPKRPAGKPGKPPEAPRQASVDDLQKLASFFNKGK